MAPAIQLAVALGHHQQRRRRLMLSPISAEEFAGQIGPAPFARAGLHVEGEERVPGILGDVAAGEGVDGDAIGQRLARARA